MEMKFYVCEHCGNIIAKVKDTGVPVMCCGQKMTEIVPGTSDGAAEKHVPVYEVSGNIVTVRVGSAEHPMAAEHYIEWVSLQPRSSLPSARVTRSRPCSPTATCTNSGRRNARNRIIR